uniref:Uncharacterized protein n=1 Tax=Ditylenchus dipsaci TaxID=166011 RepID=A0A915DB81_9BILA
MKCRLGLVVILIVGMCAAYPNTKELQQHNQQFGLHSSPSNSLNKRLTSAQQHDIKDFGNKPNPVQRIFYSQTTCADMCLVGCQAMLAENDVTLFVCPRLKPVEKSLHERFIANASWPWMVFMVVLGICLLFCCACVCWSCCCRDCSLASKGRGRDSNSSREPLAADRRIEEIIGEHPSSSSSPNEAHE